MAAYSLQITVINNPAGGYAPSCLSGCLIFSLLLFLAGCSTIPGAKTVEESRNHAEEVFRYQNRVSSRLLMLLVDNHNDKRLLDAEQRLLDACGPLNNMAIRKMKNKSTNIITQYKTRLSVRKCDHVTQDVEELLNSYQM